MADRSLHKERVDFEGAVNLKGTTTVSGPQTVSGAATHTGDLTVDSVLLNENGLPNILLGLSPHWVHNFGQVGAAITTLAAGATQTVDVQVADLLTQPNTMLKLSLALAGVASESSLPAAAVANQILASTGCSFVDAAIGTNATPGATPLVNKQIARITGNITSENVLKTEAAAALTEHQYGLIVFTGNTITQNNKVEFAFNNSDNVGLGVDFTEIITTGAGTGVLSRHAALTTTHERVILTATGGDTTILPGSYMLFVNVDDDTSGMAMKACFRTTGGTIVVTSAAT